MIVQTVPSARLLQAVDAAEPRLRAMTDQESQARRAPGAWSPREIVGHLIDSAGNNHQRFVRAAWKDDLVFEGYAQDGWVELQRYHEADWQALVTLWAAFNRHLARVMALMPGGARLRVHARHNLDVIAFRAPASSADATLEYFMGDYVDHLEHHLRQVFGADWSAEGTRGR